MMRRILYILCLLFISINSNAAIFEEGEACQGSQYLIGLTNAFDAQPIMGQGGFKSPSTQPIYSQLQNVDRNLRATTGDVAAVFQTILTLRYRGEFSEDQFVTNDPFLKAQFLAYRVMDVACQILYQDETISAQKLRTLTLEKARKNADFSHLADDYMVSLIPERGIIFGRLPAPDDNDLHRKNTFQALQAEKDRGNAIYLVLGRGNRQPAPAGQKTNDGKDIVWVYLDICPVAHSTTRGDYFLCEDFNNNLEDEVSTSLFDAVIFDRSVFPCPQRKGLIISNIIQLMSRTGSLFIPGVEKSDLPTTKKVVRKMDLKELMSFQGHESTFFYNRIAGGFFDETTIMDHDADLGFSLRPDYCGRNSKILKFSIPLEKNQKVC